MYSFDRAAYLKDRLAFLIKSQRSSRKSILSATIADRSLMQSDIATRSRKIKVMKVLLCREKDFDCDFDPKLNQDILELSRNLGLVEERVKKHGDKYMIYI